MSRIAARQRVRVARALAELPLTERAFAAGQLSSAMVRTLARVVTPRATAVSSSSAVSFARSSQAASV